MVRAYPGAIGGHIGGTIKCHKKLSPNTANITLECIYHYQSGSGKNRQSQQRVVWQTQGSTLVTVLNIAGAPESQIRFCFDVPSALPASELSATSYHSWRVTLDLTDHGTALNRQFTIPAFPSTQQSQLNITDTASNDLTQDKQQQELEALLNVRAIEGGISLHHKVGRNAKTNSVLLIVGLVFFGAGIGMGLAEDAPLFMAIIFSLVGGALSLFGFYKLLNSYYVKIGNRGLYTERYILGIKTSQHTHTPTTIKHLKIKHTGSSTSGNTHTEHFIIQAHLQNGKTVNVAESINGRAMAEYALESISMLSGYPANS